MNPREKKIVNFVTNQLDQVDDDIHEVYFDPDSTMKFFTSIGFTGNNKAEEKYVILDKEGNELDWKFIREFEEKKEALKKRKRPKKPTRVQPERGVKKRRLQLVS